jgi:hypothetical protein
MRMRRRREGESETSRAEDTVEDCTNLGGVGGAAIVVGSSILYEY